MKTKKLICGVVAVATAVTMLAGCGGDKKTSSQQGEKLTVWMPLVSNASMVVSNFGETELAKKVMEATGVEVEFTHPPQGQESEKFSIVVASANLPDIIEYNWLKYPGGPGKAIKEGVIIDLAKHADKAPNLFGYLNENQEIKKLATTDAGEVFSFPFVRGDESLCFSSGIIIREDWLKELGLAMPETIEEWEIVLTAFTEKKGCATPFSATSTKNFASGFDTVEGWYVENGKVDFSKNGLVNYNGIDWTVTGGKAVGPIPKAVKTKFEANGANTGSYASSHNYCIAVNRKQGVVVVYGKDANGKFTQPVKSFVCSCGKPNTPTPIGTYKTSDQYTWRALDGGVYGQYATRITGHILFHSVPYYQQDKGTLEAEEYNKLGSPASAGCVRLTVRDAKWIYDNCPAGTIVTIYADGNLREPLIKPTSIKLDLNDNRSYWDPTDPDVANPWK